MPRVPGCPSPEYVFTVGLLDLGEGGFGLLGTPKPEKHHKLALIMSYPSARRMGRALSALALPYKMGGSMGVHLSQEVEFTTFRRFKSTKSLNLLVVYGDETPSI